MALTIFELFPETGCYNFPFCYRNACFSDVSSNNTSFEFRSELSINKNNGRLIVCFSISFAENKCSSLL